MATSKTLTPTNVTIQIPAMTDAPDQSVNSNCIDKLGDAVNTLNSNLTSLNTPEDKQITNTASYFAERTAFKARRVGHSVNIYSYVQITTAIPSGTEFADTHFPTAEGIFLMMGGDGANPRIARCTAGKLLSDSAIPTGYYYVVGSALAPVIAN